MWASLALVMQVGVVEAEAAQCDSLVQQATTAHGEALVSAYKSLTRCDVEVARREFERFMLASKDLETLVPLTLVAVDAQAYNGVWTGMQRVPYEFREVLAKSVGEACSTSPNVLPFLQGAYAGLKGSDFAAWQPALLTCNKPEFATWMEGLVSAPPTVPYSDKYNAIISTYARLRGVDALPALERAAITAGGTGPFNNIIETMQRAVQPRSVSGQLTPEHRKAMEDALVRVAHAVPADQARLVADRLLNAGSDEVSASLLPAVFADRVQGDGTMRWAAASVESCDGEAVVHYVTWTEAPRRWVVLEGATEALRGVAPKLKCTAKELWPVLATEEPIVDNEAADGWLADLRMEWEDKGLKVKVKEEKVVIP